MFDIEQFWDDVINQNRNILKSYFTEDAVIRWHCTNEQFSVQEYIQINCVYPGKWSGNIERIERMGNQIILAGQVNAKDEKISFHVVSFIKCKDGLISEMDEYWADDSDAPEWRQKLKIGKKIHKY